MRQVSLKPQKRRWIAIIVAAIVAVTLVVVIAMEVAAAHVAVLVPIAAKTHVRDLAKAVVAVDVQV